MTATTDAGQGLQFTEAEVADLAQRHGMLLKKGEAGGFQVWSIRSRCVVGGSKHDLDLDEAAAIILTSVRPAWDANEPRPSLE
jgi:hypothetical protein